jgi:PAS domain S-box-containing protein
VSLPQQPERDDAIIQPTVVSSRTDARGLQEDLARHVTGPSAPGRPRPSKIDRRAGAAGNGTGQRSGFLSSAIAGRGERTLAFAAVLCSALVFIAAAPFARTPLPQMWAFIPIYEGALAVNELITAILLFAQFRILRSRALLLLACGYLFTVCIVVPHALTFPGLFSPTGLLGAGPQSTAWLYMFWHGAFPLFVMAYVRLKDDIHGEGLAPQRVRPSLLAGVFGVLAVVVALTLLATAGQELLPAIMRASHYTPAMILVVSTVWALSVAALLALWVRGPHSILDLWLMVVMCAWIFDVALSAVLNAGRFDLGFYAGRIYGLLAATFVLGVLLFQTGALYARLARLLDTEQQQRRHESEQRRRIFDTSLDLILVTDRRGVFLQVSPSSAAILGYEASEMIGCSAIDFVYPDDLEPIREKMRLARRGHQIRNFETRYLHKDGRVVTLVWTGVWSEPEQRHFFIGRDMTERKLVEEKFRLAVEASPSGMIMTHEGKILMVNAETERQFGYSREELIGQSIEILVPRRFRDKHPGHRSAFAALPGARGMGAGRDLFGLRKDGTEFPVEVGLNPIETRDGLVVLSVVVDITERKRNERLKGEFVATVSHELRTPLTSIAGALALLESGAVGQVPDTVKRLLGIALANSRRLSRLLNDILDIEKLEAGKVSYNLRRIDVKTLVEQAIEANVAFADSFNVKVRLDVDAAEGEVRADPDRLIQVLVNLLSNAAKFSPPRQEVLVGIRSEGDQVRLSVRDHGPGIPDEFKGRIFEKFAQGDSTDARCRGGTGLGLSIARQIVVQLGGTIGYDAAPGGGTIFYVDLPRWDASGAVELCEDGGRCDAADSELARSSGTAA